MSLTSNMNDLSLGSFTVSIANDGSIVKLIRSNNVSLVSSEHPLGLFRYQTIVKSQLDTWRSEYLIPGSGGYNEYGMPDSFMNGTNLTAYLESGRVRSVYVSSSQDKILVNLDFENSDLHEKYGAPQTFWIRYAVSQDQNDTIEVRLILLNKTATRLPEAMWFTFDTSAQDPNWQHNILGEWEDPTDIQEGASFGLHYVSDEGVRVQDTLQVLSQDAGLLRWTEPLPFPTPLKVDQTEFLESLRANGASFNLYNNGKEHTNYSSWMPFDSFGRNLCVSIQC